MPSAPSISRAHSSFSRESDKRVPIRRRRRRRQDAVRTRSNRARIRGARKVCGLRALLPRVPYTCVSSQSCSVFAPYNRSRNYSLVLSAPLKTFDFRDAGVLTVAVSQHPRRRILFARCRRLDSRQKNVPDGSETSRSDQKRVAAIRQSKTMSGANERPVQAEPWRSNSSANEFPNWRFGVFSSRWNGFAVQVPPSDCRAVSERNAREKKRLVFFQKNEWVGFIVIRFDIFPCFSLFSIVIYWTIHTQHKIRTNNNAGSTRRDSVGRSCPTCTTVDEIIISHTQPGGIFLISSSRTSFERYAYHCYYEISLRKDGCSENDITSACKTHVKRRVLISTLRNLSPRRRKRRSAHVTLLRSRAEGVFFFFRENFVVFVGSVGEKSERDLLYCSSNRYTVRVYYYRYYCVPQKRVYIHNTCVYCILVFDIIFNIGSRARPRIRYYFRSPRVRSDSARKFWLFPKRHKRLAPRRFSTNIM